MDSLGEQALLQMISYRLKPNLSPLELTPLFLLANICSDGLRAVEKKLQHLGFTSPFTTT